MPTTQNKTDSTENQSETPKLANRVLLLRGITSPQSSLGESTLVRGLLGTEAIVQSTTEVAAAAESTGTQNSADKINDEDTNVTINTVETMDAEHEEEDDDSIIPRYCNEKHVKSALHTFTLDLRNVVSEIEETGDG